MVFEQESCILILQWTLHISVADPIYIEWDN